MNESLKGKRVLITRERTQAKIFSDMIVSHGGIPIEIPLLKISCKQVQKDDFPANFNTYEWIFFTSANGVNCFFQLCEKHSVALYQLETMKFAVVGEKTANALQKYGFTASFIPSTYNAEVMAREFLAVFSPSSPIMLVRGNRSRDTLPTQFKKQDLLVDTLEVYETKYDREMQYFLLEQVKENKIDFYTFTSPSTVEAFIQLIGEEYNDQIKSFVCVCIGTTTEKRAKELGFVHTLVADPFTIEGMVQCMSNDIGEK